MHPKSHKEEDGTEIVTKVTNRLHVPILRLTDSSIRANKDSKGKRNNGSFIIFIYIF